MIARLGARRLRGFRWLLILLYVNAILWTVPYPTVISRALLHAGFPRWTLGSSGVLFAAAAVAWAASLEAPRRRLRNTGPLAFSALAYAALVWYLSPVPDEVVHLAEYGVLAMLAWWALDGAGGAASLWLAAAATGLVGLIDEITQGATPGRFFDWRDVAIDSVSGLLPLWLIASRRRSAEIG